MSANPVVNDTCVLLDQTPHTRLPVRLASGFPCALFIKSARTKRKTSGTACRGMIFACLRKAELPGGQGAFGRNATAWPLHYELPRPIG